MPVPFILLGIAIGAAVLAGCSSTREKKPAPKASCDAFAKAPEHQGVDQDSYDTVNYLWPSGVAAARMENWQPRTRLYVGAAKDLFRPLCERRDHAAAGAIAAYRKSVVAFLAAHYEGKPADASEDGVLVLIGALARADLPQKELALALDALGAGAPARQRHFRDLLLAAHFFNKAAECADAKTRFRAPRLPSKLPEARRREVRSALGEMDRILKDVDAGALTDRQHEFLVVLRRAGGLLARSHAARHSSIYIKDLEEGCEIHIIDCPLGKPCETRVKCP